MRIGIAVTFAFALVGCQATADGAIEDIRDNSINASSKLKDGIDSGANIAKDVVRGAKSAGDDIDAATQLTPRIKNAINAEPQLNLDGNVVDVDSTNENVTLSGHVSSQELRSLAGKIANEELAKAKATQILVNNLRVEKPMP